MDTPRFSPPPTATFVIRFWLERSAASARWHGSVEHIPSSERRVFLRADELLRFFRKFEIELEDPNLIPKGENS